MPPGSPGPDQFFEPNLVLTLDCDLSDGDQVSDPEPVTQVV